MILNNKRVEFYKVEVRPNTVVIGKQYDLLNGSLNIGSVEFSETETDNVFFGKFSIDADQTYDFRYKPMYRGFNTTEESLDFIDITPM